jgi:hypothetical protein
VVPSLQHAGARSNPIAGSRHNAARADREFGLVEQIPETYSPIAFCHGMIASARAFSIRAELGVGGVLERATFSPMIHLPDTWSQGLCSRSYRFEAIAQLSKPLAADSARLAGRVANAVRLTRPAHIARTNNRPIFYT